MTTSQANIGGAGGTPLRPSPSALAAHWALDPEIVFLNHGSYGACPRRTLAAQDRLRAQMEAEPIRFFHIEAPALLDAARARLAAFTGCDAAGLVFVPNATTGVAAALENLPLGPADEILAPMHEYPACLNNARRTAERRGASVRICPIPFPAPGPEEVIEAVLGAVSARTRICLISHITSATGVILPVEAIVGELEGRGIRVVVDGAHAPGQIELDIAGLGRAHGGGAGTAPSCYVANLHKWVCAPKGAAMMWIREDLRAGFRPLVLSNYAAMGAPAGRSFLHAEFDHTGTGDITPWAAIPEALDAMAALAPGGAAGAGDSRGEAGAWGAIRAHNHDLLLAGRRILCEALGVEPPAPESMLGSLCTLILPQHPPALQARLRQRPTRYHDALQDALHARWGIQVPVMYLPVAPAAGGERGPGSGAAPGVGPRAARISAQLYNSEAQYRYLAEALRAELELEAAECCATDGGRQVARAGASRRNH